MIAILFKLTRDLWGAVVLGCFILFALIVFCAKPMRGDELEKLNNEKK